MFALKRRVGEPHTPDIQRRPPGAPGAQGLRGVGRRGSGSDAEFAGLCLGMRRAFCVRGVFGRKLGKRGTQRPGRCLWKPRAPWHSLFLRPLAQGHRELTGARRPG